MILRTFGGSVCVGTQCPAPEILHEDSGPGSVATRRLLFSVGGIHGVRLSPDIHHPPNTTKSETGSGNHPPHCPVVANKENVVSRHDNPRSGVPENPSCSPGYDISADIGDSAPAAGRPPPDCLALVREAGAHGAFLIGLRPSLPAAVGNQPGRHSIPVLRDFFSSVGANHTGCFPVRHL